MKLTQKQIAKIREISYSELSRRTGLPRSTLYYILTKDQDFHISKISKICYALDISLADFFALAD